MSDKDKSENDGYVIEGNMEVAVKGHLVLYSVIGGRINYGEYSQRAQEQGLGKAYVPLPRRPNDAFAISKDILQNMQLPTLPEMEGWGSAVERRVILKPLKRGSEYAVQLELSGTMRSRRHKAVSNLYRIRFESPEDFDPKQWWKDYSDSFWDEKKEQPDDTQLRQCVQVIPYWEDQVIDDPMLFMEITSALLDEFVTVSTSVDATMLRNSVTKTLSSLGGLPFKSGSGAWFIPSFSEENAHLETLENYSNLLNYFGDRNALNRETTQTYFDDDGKPRKWYRQKSNLRVMGYIDNERQLEYIRNDIQNALSNEIADYQVKLLELSKNFNDEKIEEFEKRLNEVHTERQDLLDRLSNLSSIVGDISIPEQFRDIQEEFSGRLSSIGEVSDSVTVRLRGLMDLSQD